MQFPLNILIAAIIFVVHVLISFNLKLPSKYKNKFHIYSIAVNLIFIIFLGSFSVFFRNSSFNQGASIYYDGLASLYFLLFIPLGGALILLFRKMILKADIYSTLVKYMIIIGVSVLLIGVIALGYPIFMVTFYGFAP